jgi:hypothetical protein
MFCCRDATYLATLADFYLRGFYQSISCRGMAVLGTEYFGRVYVNPKYEEICKGVCMKKFQKHDFF